jgi:hypothetical protein
MPFGPTRHKIHAAFTELSCRGQHVFDLHALPVVRIDEAALHDAVPVPDLDGSEDCRLPLLTSKAAGSQAVSLR